MLEGALWDADKKDWESVDGSSVLRILEFSVTDEKWTGRYWKYLLEPGASAIGNFNMIDATTALVIERDDIVGNHNNLPFSSSREPNKADDNEFVLLEVESLLKAK
jgi:hypothetical protein